MKMSRKTKGQILKGAALAVDVIAPLIATLTQFPVWIERSAGSTVSGLVVVFALLSAIPIFFYFGNLIKTPSVPLMWGIALAIFVVLRNILDEMIIVSLVGLISNGFGFLLFNYGKTLCGKEDE